MASRDNELEEQYDLIYDSISNKLEQQLGSLNALDTKANILLVGIGALLTGYFQLLSSSYLNFSSYTILVILELICFIAAGYFIFRTFLLRNHPTHKKERWRDDPSPTKLLDIFSKNSAAGVYWLKDEINKSMAIAYDHNTRLLEKKYENFRIAKAMLFIGVSILFVHLIFSLYNTEHSKQNLRQDNERRHHTRQFIAQ